MKKIFFALIAVTLFSSCATIFTSSHQDITFTGLEGMKIYEAGSNIRIAQIGSSKTTTVSVKKQMSSKQYIAKKDGYESVPFMLQSSFNATSLWNILFWPGFIVDLGTGQMNKWSSPIMNIEMDKSSDQ